MQEANIDLASPDTLDLARQIFAAKSVPLDLIHKIPSYREFHRPDWPSVQDATVGNLRPFDFYFDFVIQLAGRLEALWEI